MKRRTMSLIAGGTIATFFAGLASVGVLVHKARDERTREIDARLHRELATYHAQRWERPVLRGAVVDGNAAAEQARVIDAMGALPDDPSDALGKALRSGKPAPEELIEAARGHRAWLEELRASTQRSWAWTQVAIERGPAAQLPSIPPFRRARKLLLALASDAEPDECARIAADTIRLAQDMAPGTGIVGLMVTASEIEIAAPVLMRCAARGGAEARAEAARELGILIDHPAPAGAAFEHEALMMASGVLPLAIGVPLVPTDKDTLERWAGHGQVLGAVESYLSDLPDTRRLDARRYPDGLAWLSGVGAARTSSKNPLLAMTAADSGRIIRLDATAQARLRASAAIVEAMGADPTSILARPALADPFSGKPLRWANRDGKLAVWSVGPDKNDNGGSGDDVSVQAP